MNSQPNILFLMDDLFGRTLILYTNGTVPDPAEEYSHGPISQMGAKK
jgi:hypothetical protein